jgi:hypothetical protein
MNEIINIPVPKEIARQLAELIPREKSSDYETISIRKDFIPKNGKLVEAYETENEIIVIGEPKENDESHNCDWMGCSTLSHVLYRFSKNKSVDRICGSCNGSGSVPGQIISLEKCEDCNGTGDTKRVQTT